MLLASVKPARAHAVPFSYLDLHVRPNGLEGTLVVHILDVAHDLNVAKPERLLDAVFAVQQTARISQLFASRLQVTVGGSVLTPSWSGPEVVADRQSLRFTIQYLLDGRPGVISIAARLFPYDP